MGHTKYYSNGVDLKWSRAHGTEASIGQVEEGLQEALRKLLTFPMPTIAAINGHAFGGGCTLAVAHDYRVMRLDRGWICVPAVTLGISLPPAFIGMIVQKVGDKTARKLLETAHRFTGAEACDEGIVDAAVPESEVLRWAVEKAMEVAEQAKNGETFSNIKKAMYASVVEGLSQGGVPFIRGTEHSRH